MWRLLLGPIRREWQTPDSARRPIAAAVQRAASALQVPGADRYQLFNEFDGQSVVIPGYLAMTYSGQLLIERIPGRP